MTKTFSGDHGQLSCFARDIRPGLRVDLHCDIVADPGGYAAADDPDPDAAGSEHPEFEFDFEVVLAAEVESDDCIRIDFESGFSCGFPPDHILDLDDGQEF